MGKRFGFTLAEVLITLAIIGVVAALTIPTLVTNYQQRGWNTAATVFERKLEESLKIMNTQGTLAGYKTTEDFVSELQKHLKITKVCKNDDLLSCFEDTVMYGSGEAEPEEVDMTKITTSKHFGQDDWKTNVVGLQLANGTSALLAYNPNCKEDRFSNTFVGTSCVAVLYDTTGYSKPNTSGKDLRAINVAKLGTSCAFELRGTCFGAPFIPTPLTIAECVEKKDELGIAGCWGDEDYWAGAVAQCGHVSKLASRAQVAVIGNYIYNTIRSYIEPTGGPFYAMGGGVNQMIRDDDKAASLGFDTSAPFYIMASEEVNEDCGGDICALYCPESNMVKWALPDFDKGYAVCVND